jgi:segregation and condensation protein B
VDPVEQRRSAEALILASPEPVSAARLAELVPACTPARARELVEELNAEYREQGRSFAIVGVAGGYQIRTLPEFADLVQQLQPSRPLRLSRAALETLAIVAYRQPVTRGEVEHVRGVDAGAVLKSLLERRLVRIAGHREVAGRPLLYGTTRRFLEVFGLETLDDLPTLREVAELQAPGSEAEEAPEEAAAEPAGGPDADELEGEEPEEDYAEVFAEAEPSGKPH